MATERNLRFYMANLGSEVSRYFSYIEKGQDELAEKCFLRADDILEKAIALPEAKSRLYELEIVSNTLKNLRGSSREYKEIENLKNYFLPFAERVLE